MKRREPHHASRHTVSVVPVVSAKEPTSFGPVTGERQRRIPWPTTKIQNKNNPVKRNLESSITIQATCPERRSIAAKMSLSSNLTQIGWTAVTSNKVEIVDKIGPSNRHGLGNGGDR
jgi:hypothetical protein